MGDTYAGKSFYFDIKSKRWKVVTECDMLNEIYENVPYNAFVEYDGLLLLWDTYVRKWKVVAWCEELKAYTTDGKIYGGFPILMDHSMQENICTLPMLWQVKELPEKNSVFVRAEFVELCLQQDDALPFITRLRQRKFGNCTYAMSTGGIYDYQNYQTPPTEVVKVAAEMMQVSLEKYMVEYQLLRTKIYSKKVFLRLFVFSHMNRSVIR